MSALSTIQDYFLENKYVVIRKALSMDVCQLLYYYSINAARAIDFKYYYEKDKYDKDWDGTFEDKQAYGAYSRYGDPLMDGLLMILHPMIEQYTNHKLYPNYSYWRLYQHGNVLHRHRDRDSCEISATVCMGYDVSNVDKNMYENYNWAMFVESPGRPEGLPITLEPGDLIIYKGCEIDHWREKFLGLNHAQLFVHYNSDNYHKTNLYDGRTILGVPKKYQGV